MSNVDDNDGGGTEGIPSLTIAENASWVVNIAFFAIKVVAFQLSESKSVLASLADSGVDLISQGVLAYATYKVREAKKLVNEYVQNGRSQIDDVKVRVTLPYPRGRLKTECLGVLACAAIMIMASIEVIQTSMSDLVEGISHQILPPIFLDAIVYAVLAVCITSKLIVWGYCCWVNLSAKSEMLGALAEDHLNDVFSNVGAIVGSSLAFNFPLEAWWVDPAVAIILSLVIIWRWLAIILEQVHMIDGYTAPDERIQEITEDALALKNKSITLEEIQVYFCGNDYVVELEVAASFEYRVSLQEFKQIDTYLKRTLMDNEPDIGRVLVQIHDSTGDAAAPMMLPGEQAPPHNRESDMVKADSKLAELGLGEAAAAVFSAVGGNSGAHNGHLSPKSTCKEDVPLSNKGWTSSVHPEVDASSQDKSSSPRQTEPVRRNSRGDGGGVDSSSAPRLDPRPASDQRRRSKLSDVVPFDA